MRNLIFSSLVLFVFTLFSCEDNDELTITINEISSLEIKVVDKDKKPLENADVILTDVRTQTIILNETTDNTGICKLDKILQGTYKCIVRAKKDGVTYQVSSVFQTFAKDKKVVEYSPFSNVGNINIIATTEGVPVADFTKYTVAVVSYNYSIRYVDEIKRYAQFTTNLDKDGKVQISDVPADNSYKVYIYKGDDIYASSSYFSMTKKDLDIPLLFNIGTLNITLEGEVAKFSDYDVAIVAHTYSDMSIEYIKSNTLFSAKLDDNGKATISEILKEKGYRVFLIKDNNVYDYKNFYISNNTLDISFITRTLTVNVSGINKNPENFSIALTKNRVSNISSLESEAILVGKLNTEAKVIFSELPLIDDSYYYYAYLYKDNKIYDNSSIYMGSSNNNLSTTIYTYINE
ncbi:carboxypeptidase-like regulatory domain-containing protein [Dysgonomonas sp. 520]|uniref:carboxypeptidase-like regulatory domain-containing protein n=1 Tax=Dysgonomonas sp. 520 TaxID=2302931 RepID=UPI0013D66D86|nr:carboxypeptidase-like regulatory domain-containing protein [Dysgonomonas sp. 520]NDW09919.1 carboxypeptidase regulatory-like domain-containing protein [Dysgonomonas sp. 520]